jgi:uncharacterized membrane protein
MSAAAFLMIMVVVCAGAVIISRIFPGAPSGVNIYDLVMDAYFSWGGFTNVIYSLFFVSFIFMGATFMWLDVARGGGVEFNTLFEPFKRYLHYLGAILLLFILTFLWSLLFVIPGVVKAIAYSQTCFIMREHPELGADEARKLSVRMMKGHKWHYFLLGLSFLGWVLLACITCGIGFLWVTPYIYTALGAFYEEVKQGAV